jgi:uncharacterized protein (DUF3820 family)
LKICIAEINGCKNAEPVRFYITGDWHVGNCNFDKQSARQLVDIILESKKKYPHTYVITMGDLFDLVVHSDAKRFMPATIDQSLAIADLQDLPTKQMDIAQEIFGPIMPLVIARVLGNHEGEYKKRHHIDIHETFFRRFAKPDGFIRPEGVRYIKGDGDIGYVGFFRLRLNVSTIGYQVTFCLNHGDGGGGYREGYPKNKVHDVFRWSDADYAIMGHIHQLETDYREHHSLSDNGEYKMMARWKGVSGTLLRTSVEGKANYFEHKGRPGGTIGCLLAEIRPLRIHESGKRFTANDLRLKEVRLDMPEWKYRNE